jgi:predicted kinase
MKLDENYLKADKIGQSKVVIMVGISRSGKTTEANTLILEGYSPVCRDDIRRALGVRFNQTLEEDVKKYSRVMIESLLIRGTPLILIDETNLTKKSRRSLIELCKKYKATWEFKVIDIPPDHLLRTRCEQTGFPWEVILEQKARYEAITDDEKYKAS